MLRLAERLISQERGFDYSLRVMHLRRVHNRCRLTQMILSFCILRQS